MCILQIWKKELFFRAISSFYWVLNTPRYHSDLRKSDFEIRQIMYLLWRNFYPLYLREFLTYIDDQVVKSIYLIKQIYWRTFHARTHLRALYAPKNIDKSSKICYFQSLEIAKFRGFIYIFWRAKRALEMCVSEFFWSSRCFLTTWSSMFLKNSQI